MLSSLLALTHTIEASFAKIPTVAELVSDAYIYAFPLVLMDVTADKVTSTVDRTWTQAPANQFVHVPVLADASAPQRGHHLQSGLP